MSSTTSQTLENLRRSSIILAPLAGGPSTPELVAAVSNAGGVGTLAAGYLTVEKLTEQARKTYALLDDGAGFGINLFCPNTADAGVGTSEEEVAQWTAFRNRLAPAATHFDIDLPDTPTWSDDYFSAKVEAILAEGFLPNPDALEFVSFTFGYPDKEVIAQVKESGRSVVLNATSIEGVRAATEAGADRIVLQGLAAGGHRAFVKGKDSSDSIGASVEELAQAVTEACAVTDVPIIAAGGVGNREDVVKLVEAGAVAVQVGTRFLTTAEAGTKETHRQALRDLVERATVLTHAFSGKPARAIENTFTREFSRVAPELYPQLHYLTTPIRGAANKAGDPEYLNLWAGIGFAQCEVQYAGEVVAELSGLAE